MNVNCFHLSVWKTAEGHLFTNVTVGPGGYSNPPVDFPDARFVLSHPLVFQEKSGMENDEFDEAFSALLGNLDRGDNRGLRFLVMLFQTVTDQTLDLTRLMLTGLKPAPA